MEDIPAIVPKEPTKPPTRFYGDYDPEMDTFTLQYRESIAGGVYLHQTGGFYVIVDPASHEVIGVHVDGWTSHYVSTVPALNRLWNDMQERDLDPATNLPKHTKKQESWFVNAWDALGRMWDAPKALQPASSSGQVFAHAAR